MAQRLRKVFIANRGEIAIRIARAARELGIISSAGYSVEDGPRALHACVVDEAVPLPADGGYLDINSVLQAAQEAGADCIHPGYGFLSERADFAAECQSRGILFIGPAPDTISLFGDKIAARALARRVGVDVLRGSDVGFSNADEAVQYIRSNKEYFHYPIMLKAAHGGGGRGIRKVTSENELVSSFNRCASEAATAFGKPEVFVEELLGQARHIEVQILGDSVGHHAHLYERDCSVQIRNQKLLEVAPAPGISDGLRQRLTQSALKIAAAANYCNAGTVEFLVQGTLNNESARAVFLELNPRIQVEHTVTEQMVGVDLVKAQFLIAAGQSLPEIGMSQDQLELLPGSAVQARLSLTSTGTIQGLKEPAGLGIRVDSCAYSGMKTSSQYDPLLSKIIATSYHRTHGFDNAVKLLKVALDEYWIDGVTTNRKLILQILEHPHFVSGNARTTLLQEDPKIMSDAYQAELQKSSKIHDLLKRASSTIECATTNGNIAPDNTPQGSIQSPLDGSVLSLNVKPGSRVKSGDTVVVLTAMKMETNVRTPRSGVVTDILVKEGDLVSKNSLLLIVKGIQVKDSLNSEVSNDSKESIQNWLPDIEKISKLRTLAQTMGGNEGVKRQHSLGRLTIRERITGLLDPNTFQEMGRIAGAMLTNDHGETVQFTPANFVLGTGKIASRRVVVGGEDFSIKGGSPTMAGLRKSVYTETLALELKVPLIRLHEGGGGSVGGASGSRDTSSPGPVGDPAYSRPRFESVAKCLQAVPVACAALGPVAGLPASRLVASHFSVMVENAQIMTAGPKVVGLALGYNISKEDLGGASVHTLSGVVDNIVESEQQAFEHIRTFLSYLPQNIHEPPPIISTCDPIDRAEEELASIVPHTRRQTFDMRRVFELIVDRHENASSTFFEIGNTEYGKSLITGLARINGQPVGIFGNDCRYFAGAMTAEASIKVKRLIRLCQTFSIPVISFVDQPGFMIGKEAELAGTIRHGTDVVLASQSCALPWVSIHIRKMYGVAAAAHFAPSALHLAWPSAEFGALPVESGVAVAYARQIDKVRKEQGPDAARELQQELEDKFSAGLSPFPRAQSFSVHDLIDPRETRARLCEWVDMIQSLIPSLLGKQNRTDIHSKL